MHSFKVGVIPVGESALVFNGLRFPTREAAESYAIDLAWRWTGVKSWEVVPSEDEPNR